MTVSDNAKPKLQVLTDSEEATNRLGLKLAAVVRPGTVIALVGDLGAGKTRLVQAIAAGLEVAQDMVNSPTFTLVQEYPGRIPLRHCDTYRLRDPDEFLDLGLDELLAPDGIALIEWADRVFHLLPRDTLRIDIRILSPTAREFVIAATGRTAGTILAELAGVLAMDR
ncbi:MAG: tRNA (adenosine(37)-N6)-threonylcarbamoyltransferase complex ATPase subunit type 1 TsaE [Planctomycetes bacterium]|nr:tRNA (adenosine(37)-N6)-threonylcarbamoyltransferase complex ATPase subunit type 1 TsaE [Planctomycetota bacterium]